MLVFTRRLGEIITIGDGVEVRVLRVGRNHVRLGIVAPPDVPVHRLEVYELVRELNLAAAAGTADAQSLAARIRKTT